MFARVGEFEMGGIHLASLVLGDLVLLVLVAVLGLAVRPAGFRNVDLVARETRSAFCGSNFA